MSLARLGDPNKSTAGGGGSHIIGYVIIVNDPI